MNNYESYESLTDDILKNRHFQKIGLETHHGITRLEHSCRVARYTYKYAIKWHLDYRSATKAALLHDFFIDEDFVNIKGLYKGVAHPDIALANAKREFGLNELEENAIEAHMFPLNMTLPRYKESWLITGIDKMVAIYELATSFVRILGLQKVKTYALLYSLFLFNIITMGQK